MFTPAYNPQTWLQTKDRLLAGRTRRREGSDRPAQRRARSASSNPAEERRRCKRGPYEEKLRSKKAEVVPAEVRGGLLVALAAPAAKRTQVEKVPGAEARARREGVAERSNAALSQEDDAAIAERSKTRSPIEAAASVTTENCRRFMMSGRRRRRSFPPPRQSWKHPAAKCNPGFLTVLTEPGKPTVILPTIRRGTAAAGLAFAQWLTEPTRRRAGWSRA